METKTNPMRHLEKLGIPYTAHHYEGGVLSGIEVAKVQGQDPDLVFKTLVTEGKERSYYVFLVPSPATWISRRQPQASGRSRSR